LNDIASLFSQSLGPWTVSEVLAAFGILIAALIVRSVLLAAVTRRLRRLAERTSTEADDLAVKALMGPLGALTLLAGLYLALRVLAGDYPEALSLGALAFRLLAIYTVAWALFRLADAVGQGMMELAARTESRLDDQLVPPGRKAIKILVGIMAFVLTVQTLGYSVSGLLAGLGIGGLAFALAAKDTVANVFGSITILVDRPFRVGDWITTDGADGVVEEIGLRSTRIRTFAKTVVSLPNQGLANATVENHSLMPKRRVKMTVGVTYSSSAAQMQTLVARIEALLRARDDVHQEFLLVKFTDFGASSLDVLIYYFTATTDWAAHLQARQEINLAVMGIVEEMGLSIAFPTRTVHLVTEGSADAGD